MSTLEVEVDLNLTPEDEAKIEEYVEHTSMDRAAAVRQVAQDILGHTGAVVQHAEEVKT